MTVRTRFIKSVVASAKATQADMPWTRGSTRRKTIMRRSAQVALPLRAKAASA